MTVLATIIVLGVLIFVHELGHFLAARSVGVRVERFSIGLGPKIYGFRRGETEYVLSWIPLGGYVKMGGMDDEVMEAIEGGKGEKEGEAAPADAEGDGGGFEGEPGRESAVREGPRSSDFDAKPVWARAWVISAGVIMNMIFAFVAFAVVAGGWGAAEPGTTRIGIVDVEALPPEAAGLAEIPPGSPLLRIADREVTHWGEVREAFLTAPSEPFTVTFTGPEGVESATRVQLPADVDARTEVLRRVGFWIEPELVAVEPGSPAAQGGLQAGDRILRVDGEEIRIWGDLVRAIQARPEQATEITLLRGGGEMVRTVTPNSTRGEDAVTGEVRAIGVIGVAPLFPETAYTPVGPVEAIAVGWDETVWVTGMILGFLRDLVTGQISPRNLGSIVAIGEASGQAAAEGIPVFLRFMALFSINLAILNLLPIPVLDGGHLVFLGFEAVRGKPLSVEQRIRWSQVGFVVLIGIMVLALGNDFLRLFGL